MTAEIVSAEEAKSVHTEKPYPKYSTYDEGEGGRHPSLLSQEYPRPTFRANENYYPANELLAPYFVTHCESHKFGAASFCGFLEDTVEVEHCLVIPAIASLRRLPYDIPAVAEQDLYKLATDEGFHAEQSQQFLTDLRSHFGLVRLEEYRTPLFLRRLEQQRAAESNPFYRDLITVLNGVVTETRISIELSKFAIDKSLGEPVRTVCRTHAEDESIHASQFKALGEWLWEQFDEATKVAAARFFSASTIARSMPDVDRMAFFFHQSTNRPLAECKKIVYSVYTADVLIDRLLIETQPTVSFLKNLGVDKYMPFSLVLEQERQLLRTEMAKRQEAAHAQDTC